MSVWGPKPMGLRKFRSLCRGIPAHDSAIGAALGAPQPGEWSSLHELVAVSIEVADQGNRLFHSAHKKRGTSAMQPIKLKRPKRRKPKKANGTDQAEPERRRRPATSEDLKAFFAGGKVRYTGPAKPGAVAPTRCGRGHWVRPGEPCSACAARPATSAVEVPQPM